MSLGRTARSWPGGGSQEKTANLSAALPTAFARRNSDFSRLTVADLPGIKLPPMPTYEYICSKCGHEFEIFQSIADQPLTICPRDKCARKRWGRGKVKKKIGAGAGLIFKGSGFYATDYRSEKYKESAKRESAAASSASGASKPASTADTKPAAKKEGSPAKTDGKSSS